MIHQQHLRWIGQFLLGIYPMYTLELSKKLWWIF